MIARVVAIPDTASVLEAAEFFVQHRLLALPVVDSQRRIRGVVDVGMFTEEMYDLAERREIDDMFQLIGLRISELQTASAWSAFSQRFRWLLATMASGLSCAVLASMFEGVLAQVIVLASFMALILGLSESVSMQSMTVSLAQLHLAHSARRTFGDRLRRELGPAVLLGLSCGALIGLVALVWRREPDSALVIGGSILASMVAACVLGISVPTLLHRLRWDPKIAAGPLTLALVDLCTLSLYLNAARWVAA
jgi:magnesium transporter